VQPPIARVDGCAGLTVLEIADQLGHKRISITQDTYFGLAQPSPKVAVLLDPVMSDLAVMLATVRTTSITKGDQS
jgi:hypothetical protein